jgi:hypothetical protein
MRIENLRDNRERGNPQRAEKTKSKRRCRWFACGEEVTVMVIQCYLTRITAELVLDGRSNRRPLVVDEFGEVGFAECLLEKRKHGMPGTALSSLPLNHVGRG